MTRQIFPYLFALIMLGLVCGKSSLASRVVKVTSDQKKVVVKHFKRTKWKVSDRLCIYEKRQKIACGRVVKVKKRRALVKILFAKGEITKGQRIRRLKRRFSVADKTALGLGREPALFDRPDLLGNGNVKEKVKPGRYLLWDITAGANLGLNHFYPFLHVQRAITPHWTGGIQPIYLSSSVETDSLSAMGGFLTANYYGFQPFRGLWVQGALGFYSFSATTAVNEESASSFAFQTTVGWREKWVYGLNLAIGAGFQYLTAPNITILDIKYQNFQLIVAAEIGFAF